MSVVNPLLVLRQELKAHPEAPLAFIDENGQELADDLESCKYVRIGTMFFLRDSATCFKSKRGSGPYYPLDAVSFLLKSPDVRELAYGEYMSLTRKSNVGSISLVDKKDLLSYVEDHKEDMSSVDPAAPLVPFASSFKEAKSLVHAVSTEIPTQDIFFEPAVVTTRPLRTTNSIFTSSKDFSNVLEISKTIFKASEKEQPQAMSLVESIKTANIDPGKETTPKRRKGVPIIIVPSVPTAMLSMYNAKSFLEDSTFVPTADAKAAATGAKQPSITFEKQTGQGKTLTYQIIDNPSRLSIEEWGRVAAVFVHGPAWQFKGWKWENPVELFQNGTDKLVI